MPTHPNLSCETVTVTGPPASGTTRCSCLPFAVSDTVTPGLHGRHHRPAHRGHRLMNHAGANSPPNLIPAITLPAPTSCAAPGDQRANAGVIGPRPGYQTPRP